MHASSFFYLSVEVLRTNSPDPFTAGDSESLPSQPKSEITQTTHQSSLSEWHV
uniref:Uncharacterized protein n=1 Tax=Anguilla anguilla TaxID=7936 RepID=A0A0E9TQ86_ANGAN